MTFQASCSGNKHGRLYLTVRYRWTSQVVLVVKNPPANAGDRVQSLDQKSPLKRKWQPILVFLSGKFHGQKSLVGYSSQGHKESDTTERLSTHVVYRKETDKLDLYTFQSTIKRVLYF